MRVFHCDHCGRSVYFENVFCSNCNHKLAYLPDIKVVASLDPAGTAEKQLWKTPVKRAEGKKYRLCQNYSESNVCNWAVPEDDPNPFCRSCRLTRVIPDLSVPGSECAWRRLEAAKRRLVYSLLELLLPVRNMIEDPEHGLAFSFMSDYPNGQKVLTGHDEGHITVNIAEADDVERERRRVSMHEPYRTLLGHFRHEIGHYYWDILIRDSARIEDYRKLFGDERLDYDQALRDHYSKGPRTDWRDSFVSEYASVHPWEDWAETWAHYLHMTDTLETAATSGLSLQPDRPDEPAMAKRPDKPAHELKFDEIIHNWFPLTFVLNNLNRGMGLGDAYPFVLPPPAIEKLRFVHQTICSASEE